MPEKESYNPSETTEDVSTPWDSLTETGQDVPATPETPEEPQEKPKVVVDKDYLTDEKNAHNGEHFMTEEENAEYHRRRGAGDSPCGLHTDKDIRLQTKISGSCSIFSEHDRYIRQNYD